jgi:hypothetical protein
MLPDLDRAERIGDFWGHPETRTFGRVLIDPEEDEAAPAVVFGLLAEMERGGAAAKRRTAVQSRIGPPGTEMPDLRVDTR